MTVFDSWSLLPASTTQLHTYCVLCSVCKLLILVPINNTQWKIRYAMCMILNNVDLIPFLFEEGACYFEQKNLHVCVCVVCVCVCKMRVFFCEHCLAVLNWQQWVCPKTWAAQRQLGMDSTPFLFSTQSSTHASCLCRPESIPYHVCQKLCNNSVWPPTSLNCLSLHTTLGWAVALIITIWRPKNETGLSIR